jgi:hypothetical protein
MSTVKNPIPPVDIIQEDSGPPLPDMQERQDKNSIDIDDAQIQEPKDDAFKKAPKTEADAKRRRKRA